MGRLGRFRKGPDQVGDVNYGVKSTFDVWCVSINAKREKENAYDFMPWSLHLQSRGMRMVEIIGVPNLRKV